MLDQQCIINGGGEAPLMPLVKTRHISMGNPPLDSEAALSW